MTEPAWCSFCEDQPAAGRMLVVEGETRAVVAELEFEEYGACGNCGITYTGCPIPETIAKPGLEFQFEHLDFREVTQEQLDAVARRLEICCVCETSMGPPEAWAVRRLIQQTPQAALDPENHPLTATCGKCSSLGLCPHCGDNCSENH